MFVWCNDSGGASKTIQTHNSKFECLM